MTTSRLGWRALLVARIIIGSFYVSRKLPTNPSPEPTFCPKKELHVSVNLGFGGGGGGGGVRWAISQKRKMIPTIAIFNEGVNHSNR